MKRLGVCFLVWLVVGLGAGWADEASHRQAVEALFDQLGMEAVMNATVSQMAAAITGAVPEDMGYHDVVDAFVKKYLGWTALKPAVVDVYMRSFSEAEIRELSEFYQTDVGQKLVAVSPAMSQEISVLVHGRLVANQGDLIQMMMDADFLSFQQFLGAVGTPADAPQPR